MPPGLCPNLVLFSTIFSIGLSYPISFTSPGLLCQVSRKIIISNCDTYLTNSGSETLLNIPSIFHEIQLINLSVTVPWS